MKSRWLVILMTVVLLITVAVPAYALSLSKSELYESAKTELEKYLNDEATMSLDDLFMRFSELGSYEMSIEFVLYTDVLRSIENEDYGRVFVFTSILRQNTSFGNYLDEEKVYGTIDELECYARGRQAEQSGDMKSAYEYYNSCLTFMDSSLRVRKQLVADLDEKYQEALQAYALNTFAGYQKAYELFCELAAYNYENSAALMSTAKVLMDALAVQLMPTVTPTATPTATPAPAPTPTPQPEKASEPVPTERWGAWSEWSTEKVDPDSKTQVEKRTEYRSRKIIKNQGYTDWSAWSDWTTTPATKTNTKDVQTKVEYRYCDTKYETQYSDWSSWSEWSTTAVSETNLRDVETNTEEKVTTTYSYKHWRYYNTNEGKWMSSYGEYKSGGYKEGSGKWESITVSKPLQASGTRDGRTYYRYNGQNWYSQTKKETKETITYYRYRTRTEKQVPVTGSWSAWSSNKVTATSTRQVENRTLYRVRTCKLDTWNTFGKWSDWSDKQVRENSELAVETRTVYRYRKLK